MKITHRVSLSATAAIRRELESFGISVGDGFSSFELTEDDERWARLAPMIAKWQAVDVPMTKFTAKELRNAEWLQMVPVWHHGYPQPDDDFGYLAATYDTTGLCSECGVGLVQNAPFRMKREPKWGTRSILQLHWVFGEFFCTPALADALHEQFRIGSRAVVDSTENRELQTVVQLLVTEKVGVVTDGLDTELCPACGSSKYAPIARGQFPELPIVPRGHIARTTEHFGSGAAAHQPIIVSQDLLRVLNAKRAKGAGFVPVMKS